jgi:precorrin-6B methylase 2
MHEDVLGALAEARALGFLGPGPLEAHVESAAAFERALGPLEGPALDLGSGGGVPGLLLAAAYPDVRWVLLDKHRRRTSFLARAVADLGWVGRVEVVRAAAEEAGRDPRWREAFVAVVARSFGPPAMTAEIGVAFLQPAGRLVVGEPPEADAARWPAEPLRELGLELISVGRVAVLGRRGGLDEAVPRSWKMLERRPRW